MADENVYCGNWKIIRCVSLAGGAEASDIEGTVFTLDESGDLSWKIPESAEPMPFFNCETYEVYLGNPHHIRFFGTFAGHMIEFRVDQPEEDSINLIYEGWCVLQCEKMTSKDSRQEEPFSFLRALEEGYFSDVTIVGSSGKEFQVHSTLLQLGNDAINWSENNPLNGLPDDVIQTTLHYLYCECLPQNLKEDTAKACLATIAGYPGFERFRQLCELFVKNSALKQQIISLVTDMHSCASHIIDFFSGKGQEDSLTSSREEGNLPARLCYIIKQSLRECAVASSKLLILCDLFSRKKNELSREERHEIIKYCVSRLPVFMNQLQKLLEVIRQSFGSLSSPERMEIAAYLVPEIEASLDSMFQLMMETKSALEQMISTSSNDKTCCASLDRNKKHPSMGEVLSKSLKNALHLRELRKLRSLYEKVTINFMNLMHKKESFTDMSSGNKMRCIAKKLEQFIDEIPMFLLRIEELRSAVMEKQSWKEWKFLFKLGTSKVAWILNKLVSHRSTLKTVVNHLCDVVGREQFTMALLQLGILERVASGVAAEKTTFQMPISEGNSPVCCGAAPQLEVMDSLSLPPVAKDSKLAKKSVELLRSGQDVDMCFEIVAHGHQESGTEEENCIERLPGSLIEAHRVIVATRCDWLRRALLSGMRESIDRKIIVHDTNPTVFKVFLEYLYSGTLETQNLSTEQLAELMQLSDRYEVDLLKQISEEALKDHVDEDSALFLLSLADQLNARNLRNTALEFIAINKEIIKSEVFYELPEDLQSEVEEMITWFDLRSSQRSEDLSCPQFLRGGDSPSSMSSSLLDIEEFTSAVNISGKEGESHSDSSSLEDLPLTQDSAQLEECVAQLRDVVGESVPREELVRVSLAADYDVNRALNFFFA